MLNTFVGYTIFLISVYLLHIHYVFALIVEYTVSILHSYVWNKKWTFRSANNVGGEIVKFFCVYVTMFVFNYAFLLVLINFFKIEAALAQIIAIIFLTPITFVLHKKWSFYYRKSGAN